MATAGAGKNGGSRLKQRQWRGQTTFNQKATAIAVEMVIMAAAMTAATETATAEMAVVAAAPLVAEAATDASAAAWWNAIGVRE